jgi:small subunit ribosomal protein S1
VAKYQIGDVIEGTVTKLVNFGAFVRVEEGLEGLIHISELSNQRVAHPGDVVKESEVLKLKIISLDSERHRLGLSLKQAEDRPAATEAAPSPMPQQRYEERPQRRERGRDRDRRDRAYRPEDAISEPDEGIDNTMAAAFASSGFFDQFRSEEPTAAEAAPSEPEPAEAAEPADAAGTTEAADATEAAETSDAVDTAEAAEPAAAEEPTAAAETEEPAAAEEPTAAAETEEPAAAEESAVAEADEPAAADGEAKITAEAEAAAEAEPEAEPAESAKA